MHHAFAMSDFQGAADLKNDAGSLVGWQLTLFIEDSTEILPLQILHRDELEAVRLTKIENADDVAVCDLAGEDEFLLEAPQHFRIGGKFGANDFQCDQTLKFNIVGFVNRAHSALAQERDDFIALAKYHARFKFPLGTNGDLCAGNRSRPVSGSCWRHGRRDCSKWV